MGRSRERVANQHDAWRHVFFLVVDPYKFVAPADDDRPAQRDPICHLVGEPILGDR